MTQATRAELASALKSAIEVMNKNCGIAVIGRLSSGEANLHDALTDIGESLKDEVARLEKILTPPIEK